MTPSSGPSDGHPTTTRPQYLRWGPIGLVLVGGALGAGAREALSLLIPDVNDVPIAIVVVNLIGAFLLGMLYQSLAQHRGEADRGDTLKPLLGTGFCGGFTTYSSLATDTAVLFRDGQLWTGVAYALVTVIAGAGATWLGIVVGASRPRPAHARRMTWRIGDDS